MRRLVREGAQGLCTLVTGLASGQPDLDDSALREQRKRVGIGQQRIPVESALGDVKLALGMTFSASGTSDTVRRLGCQ